MEKQSKKVLWITNMMPGFVASHLGLKGTNKEGWIEGTARRIMQDNMVQLAIAFPVNDLSQAGRINNNAKDNMHFYGFLEDTNHPENYDEELENRLEEILTDFAPDVIHVFGTEFPHTLALMNIGKWNDKTLIHIQGVMEECEKVYTGNIPDSVVKRKTLRDILRKDSIEEQLCKYKKRADNEHEALIKAKHVLGRTEFDKSFIYKLNPECEYHKVNETLRKSFYDASWDLTKINRHEIFVSQGNYPLKGAHVVIKALGLLKEKYSDIRLYIAGDKITAYETIKDKIKLSSYGKYLRDLIKEYQLENNVVFTGTLTEEQMLDRFKSAEVFVLSSFVENSPNSLGEAMLIGMPTISTKAGGVKSIATNEQETLMYDPKSEHELSSLIIRIFEDDKLKIMLGENARKRAKITHDDELNYQSLIDVYNKIAGIE